MNSYQKIKTEVVMLRKELEFFRRQNFALQSKVDILLKSLRIYTLGGKEFERRYKKYIKICNGGKS